MARGVHYFHFQIVPGFLFLQFCGNLNSQGKMLLQADSRSLNQIVVLSFVRIAILSKKKCSIKAKSRKVNEQYIYVLTYVLFLDKLCVKCESFKAIE